MEVPEANRVGTIVSLSVIEEPAGVHYGLKTMMATVQNDPCDCQSAFSCSQFVVVHKCTTRSEEGHNRICRRKHPKIVLAHTPCLH